MAWLTISGIAYDAQGNEDPTNEHYDLAPDPGHGMYTYTVQAKLQLKQTAFSMAPNPAKAGKKLAVSLAGTENDTNGPIGAGTVACSAKAGAITLRATHTLSNGVATCYFTVPKSAKGKTIHGTVSVTVQGVTLAKSFTTKVK
jgi:hypothetical protein